MSLGRLLLEQGQRDEGRVIVCQTYEGFTEGFDTADLREAWSLLNALEGGA